MAARKGESHHKAKLIEEDVREIRKRYSEGESAESIWLSTFLELGIESPTTIAMAARRKTWRHVT
ncbi:hypothetical protein [Streptomyces sp. S1]|uniref:hypothetical protein n=1 Tax=Streptomyces sp. S1 TaxID=718288 RepID=UPI003D75D62A